ncbi:MAG: four helix bundle suffix domain-containing protein [Muribaculaceae bacterium]
MIIYDITFLFTRRFLSPSDRTTDQMVQAARSCKQNIVEGSKAATTSLETQLKLTNVAKASLQELLEDFIDYLRVRDLALWDKDSAKALQTRRFCASHLDDAYYRQAVKVRSDETVANIAIILIHQADVLLQGLINRQQSDFLTQGGIREQMSQARRQWRSSHPTSGCDQCRPPQPPQSSPSAPSLQSQQPPQSPLSHQPSECSECSECSESSPK